MAVSFPFASSSLSVAYMEFLSNVGMSSGALSVPTAPWVPILVLPPPPCNVSFTMSSMTVELGPGHHHLPSAQHRAWHTVDAQCCAPLNAQQDHTAVSWGQSGACLAEQGLSLGMTRMGALSLALQLELPATN